MILWRELGTLVDGGQLFLAMMGVGGPDACLTAAQARVLLFLLDTEAAHLFSGPHFHWVPSRFGPTDPAVHQMVERLADRALMNIRKLKRSRLYRLSRGGQVVAMRNLSTLDPNSSEYLKNTFSWIKSMDERTLIEDEIQSRYHHMTLFPGRPSYLLHDS
jgi:hypothetical protein